MPTNVGCIELRARGLLVDEHPSRGVRGQPASTNSVRTPLLRVKRLPTIVALPTRKRWESSFEVWMLDPLRLARPARSVNVCSNQSRPVLRSRSFELRNARYSAISGWPASLARRSASASANAQASSSSLTIVSGIGSCKSLTQAYYSRRRAERCYHDAESPIAQCSIGIMKAPPARTNHCNEIHQFNRRSEIAGNSGVNRRRRLFYFFRCKSFRPDKIAVSCTHRPRKRSRRCAGRSNKTTFRERAGESKTTQ